MNPFDLLSKKSKIIIELQQENKLIKEKISIYESKFNLLNHQNAELSNKCNSQEEKIKKLENNNINLGQKIEYYYNQNQDLVLENQKKKDEIVSLKEKSNLLKTYEERFGDITGFDNLKKDAVGDYDIDKEFFDYLSKQRGGKSFSDESFNHSQE